MDLTPNLAIIGGSGLYSMAKLHDTQEYDLETPFGKPSAPIIVGTLEGKRIAFLARHGLGHAISPSRVLTGEYLCLSLSELSGSISISACGSLREDFIPAKVVIPDQLMDFTLKRIALTFRH
jgi:5'-methylthioadenosine phosphorylase